MRPNLQESHIFLHFSNSSFGYNLWIKYSTETKLALHKQVNSLMVHPHSSYDQDESKNFTTCPMWHRLTLLSSVAFTVLIWINDHFEFLVLWSHDATITLLLEPFIVMEQHPNFTDYSFLNSESILLHAFYCKIMLVLTCKILADPITHLV